MLKVTAHNGMVDITGNGISYGNIAKMYKNGHGHGLQVDENLEQKREQIMRLCDEVSEKIYALQSLVNAQPLNASEATNGNDEKGKN